MRKNFGEKPVATLLWLGFATAIAFLVRQVTTGSSTLNLAALHLFGVDIVFGLRLDPLSTTIFTMVSLLAAVIGQFSLRYLDGDPRQWRFFGFLSFTATAVSLLVLSSNLVMFVAAWLAISWGLHQLLILHAHRQAAVYAARKKFLVSRLGDVAILAGVALIYRLFGTFDFEQIFIRAESAMTTLPQADQTMLSIAAVLLAAGAMTKSAQVPFHFWLPETMETPTPVSAMMHAGIINAGGFLVLRLSPIISHADLASAMLAVTGAITAVYGALVMATQNNIKSKLAFSTISQMGMMMFACGIHAYTFALFHIIAHSCYKAHAFLSTASLVEDRRRLALPLIPLRGPATVLAVSTGYGLILFGAYWRAGIYLSSLTYAAVLFIGLSQNSSLRGIGLTASFPLRARVTATLFAVLVAYGVIETALGSFVATQTKGSPSLLVNSIAFFVFATGLVLTNTVVEQRTMMARRIYMWLWNGSYLGNASTRVLSRIWPA